MTTRIGGLSWTFAALIFMALLTACSEPGENTAPVVIGMLETREYLITLYASPDGPLYAVQDFEGTVLEQDISIETMVARYPELTWLQNNNTIEWAGLDGGVLVP